MEIKVLTVTEVNTYLKRILDNDFILNNLSVKGEISNLTYHYSGHIYFSIKDSSGKLSCVMFKSNAMNLKMKLKEGMSVIIKGRISMYPQSGAVQLYCDEIEEEGLGKLYIEYEKLKDKLYKQGYFDDDHKKNIQGIPQRIGVVTSATGAVFHDIINVTRKRSSLVDIVLYPAKVQGEGAYKEIIQGIEYFNEKESVDLIIIGRGGGSIEELWNFNEEELAIAIYNSKLPIISAVGHEVDYTIADFVSDIRAATPSQAAEFAVPLESDIRNYIDNCNKSLDKIIENIISSEKEKIESCMRILNLNSPITKVVNSYREVEELYKRLQLSMQKKIDIEKQQLIGMNSLLVAHNPINLLQKGYAIIEDNEGVISTKDRLKDTKQITITLKDGKVQGEFTPHV
ncbi:exodeoxyribonuclease VII large subunit [Clostridium sp. MSJ-8]|uniref:exodeoxyribonuclease VII large subunit n=1 Tax=Clostridium sp. MSJ-8 TaxID=2841510 RepID=UPI001C0EC719|nr:exodeoxyribonuclease VII large subunit [Clostridium sp. MSJ-8]MBU5487525.1 exodeoxyribonuclease VII large subunit [Clostridium sp. MSJ-8]